MVILYSRKQRKMVRYYLFGLQSSIVLTFLIAAVFKTSSCAITFTYKAKFCKIKMQVLLRTQKNTQVGCKWAGLENFVAV